MKPSLSVNMYQSFDVRIIKKKSFDSMLAVKSCFQGTENTKWTFVFQRRRKHLGLNIF